MEQMVMKNFINGEWVESASKEWGDIYNPAKGEIIGKVPLSTKSEVLQTIQAARDAFQEWREIPPASRVKYLYNLKSIMEKRFEDLARTLTLEEGKTLDEARGEVRRGIENIDVALGIPSLMMGYNLEDISKDIDCYAVRQPLGVFACIAPFNFPAMVPLWFVPFALATGNTYIVKPSEQVPMSQQKLFECIEAADFPEGVINLVNGAKEVVDILLESPDIKGISFVGSSPVAKYIYKKCGEFGKRVQALGGAKNSVTIMPDAVLEKTIPNVITSCFGAAGERCLSASVILVMDPIYEEFKTRFVEAARKLKVGNGMEEGSQMGPVVSAKHRDKILSYIEIGLNEGATLLLDGRTRKVPGCENGYFIGPTIFENATPEMRIVKEEIFGPVVALIRVKDLEAALQIYHQSEFGNAAMIFTSSGKAARTFQYHVGCSMIGINIGIAAPMAFFSFGGAKGSFFGDLKGHGRDAIEFFTDKRMISTRWF